MLARTIQCFVTPKGVQKFDATARLVVSFGSGLFSWPHEQTPLNAARGQVPQPYLFMVPQRREEAASDNPNTLIDQVCNERLAIVDSAIGQTLPPKTRGRDRARKPAPANLWPSKVGGILLSYGCCSRLLSSSISGGNRLKKRCSR
jgi:hypothetical protein